MWQEGRKRKVKKDVCGRIWKFATSRSRTSVVPYMRTVYWIKHFVALFIAGPKLAEQHSKSPDLASWGTPVIVKTEIQLRLQEGMMHVPHVRFAAFSVAPVRGRHGNIRSNV